MCMFALGECVTKHFVAVDHHLYGSEIIPANLALSSPTDEIIIGPERYDYFNIITFTIRTNHITVHQLPWRIP